MAFARSLFGSLFGKVEGNQSDAASPAQQSAPTGRTETSFKYGYTPTFFGLPKAHSQQIFPRGTSGKQKGKYVKTVCCL